jgi:hypothetical protein
MKTRKNPIPAKWHTVKLSMVGDDAKTVVHLFSVRSRQMTKPIRNALRDGYNLSGRYLSTDVDLLLMLLSGWGNINDESNQELEFTRENVIKLVHCYPHATRAILDALLADVASS